MKSKILDKYKQYLNQSKIVKVKNNKHLYNEINFIENKIKKGIEYYSYIIENVQIDKQNQNNSFIMWVLDKVDTIDMECHVKITAGRKELPDIDTDFGIKDREWVIDYLKDQYGENNVAQMVTLQRMQGKAALKDIFRVSGIENYFELGNAISKYMENEAAVADELRELRDEHGKEYGLIQYAIEHSDEVRKFYEDEKLTELFDLAMRCENRKRSQGKHPSGVVITPKPIAECFPLVIDTKTKEHIVGLEMDDAAKAGSVKLDVLAVAILDKMKAVEDMVNGN